MKNMARSKTTGKKRAGLRREYKFDYTKSRPNRFANASRPAAVAVLLDPDVARVFTDAQAVNDVLRALLTTMPAHRGDDGLR
jgi:hypothetical protein